MSKQNKKRHIIGDDYILLERGTEWKLVLPHPVLTCTHSLNWRDEGDQMWRDVDSPVFSVTEFQHRQRPTISEETFRKLCGNHLFILKSVVEKEYEKTEITVKCDCSASSADTTCCLCGGTGFYKKNIYKKRRNVTKIKKLKEKK